MKKFLFCFAISFVFVCSVFSDKTNGKTEFEFLTDKHSKAVSFDLKKEKFSYRIRIKQESYGGFSYHPVPLFIFDFENTYIGEMKISKKGIWKPSVLSENPAYAGILRSFENIEFAVFSPIFAPSSPNGAMLSFRHKNNVFLLLYENRSSSNSSSIPSTWEVDWQSRKNKGNTLRSIVFLHDRNFDSVFDFSVNEFAGFQSESELSFNYRGFSVYSSHGKNSENIFSFMTGNQKKLKLSLLINTGPQPVYGGQAQEATVRFSAELIHGKYSFSSVSENIYSEDTGMQAATLFGLSVKENSFFAQMIFPYERTSGKDNGFTVPDFSFHSDGIRLKVEKAQGELEFYRTIKVINRNFEVSIDQDRSLSIKGSITY